MEVRQALLNRRIGHAETSADGHRCREIGEVGTAGQGIDRLNVFVHVFSGEHHASPTGLSVVLAQPGAGHLVLCIEQGNGRHLHVEWLKGKEPLLRGAVCLKRSVAIQVVGREIRQERDARRFSNLGQLLHLKAGDLQDDQVAGLNPAEDGQERLVADIAAEPDLLIGSRDGWFRLLQQMCRQGRGRALAVGAGDPDDPRGAQLEEQAHLRGDGPAVPAGNLEELVFRTDGRVGDNHVGSREIVRIMPAEAILDALPIGQLPDGILQLLSCRLIRDHHVGPRFDRKASRIDTAAKAAQAHHEDSLAGQRHIHIATHAPGPSCLDRSRPRRTSTG